MSDNFIIPKIHPNKVRVLNSKLTREFTGFADEYKLDGKLFTGYCVISVYPNGVIKYETESINGEFMGWINEYYENGNPKVRELHAYGVTIYMLKYDINNNLTFELTPTPEYLDEMKKSYPLDYEY